MVYSHAELSSSEEVLLNRMQNTRGRELSTGMKVRDAGLSEESKGEVRLAKASQHEIRRTVGPAQYYLVYYHGRLMGFTSASAQLRA